VASIERKSEIMEQSKQQSDKSSEELSDEGQNSWEMGKKNNKKFKKIDDFELCSNRTSQTTKASTIHKSESKEKDHQFDFNKQLNRITSWSEKYKEQTKNKKEESSELDNLKRKKLMICLPWIILNYKNCLLTLPLEPKDSDIEVETIILEIDKDFDAKDEVK
jgi:hypothetical protein